MKVGEYNPNVYKMKPYRPYRPMNRVNVRGNNPNRPMEKKNLPNVRQAYISTRFRK